MKKKKKKSATPPKKAAKRATRGAVNKVKEKGKKGPGTKSPAAKPKKQKKTKPSPAKKTAPTSGAAKGKPTANTLVTPNICVPNFSASNGAPVQFVLPVAQVTITQVAGNSFPFTPVTGSNGAGMEYTTVTSGSTLTVSVPTINKSYPYQISCTCPGLEGTHSVTVGS
jgi:hypothetical protein